MGIRKCIVPQCPSNTARPEDRGVTFHKIPFNDEWKRQWITACHLPDDYNATKTTNVCSRHFRKADFQEFKGKKYVLKFGVVPTVFAWTIAPGSGSKATKSPVKSEPKEGGEEEEFEHEVGDKDDDIVLIDDVKIKQEKTDSPARTTTKASSKSPTKRASSAGKQSARTPSKQARLEPSTPSGSKKQTPKKGSSTPKSTPTSEAVADGGNSAPAGEKGSIDFTPGAKIEAQDFSGRWHPASLLEVDTEEREVLVQFDKAEKAKTNEEWIPMDSVRLRPQQSSNFAIGEKVFARWSDSRKFKATIKSVLENDMYEVLFDDGFAKICKSTHISRLKRTEEAMLKPPTVETEQTVPHNSEEQPQQQQSGMSVQVKTEQPEQGEAKDAPVPLVSLSQLCIPQVVKVSDLPEIPKDGEWCCHWMNDYPVGEESELDLPGGRVYTVVVSDWRLPEGWVKHIFQRVTAYGKMDTVLVTPTGKMLRSKKETKLYLEELGEPYDENTYDFGLHKKRAKDLGFCHYTQEYKDSFLPKPAAEPVLLNTEVNIGSVKVKIIDNLFQCPEADCLKTTSVATPGTSGTTTKQSKSQSKITKIKLFSQKKQKGSLSKVRRGFVTKGGSSAKKVKRAKAASQRALANRSAPVLGSNDSIVGERPFAGFSGADFGHETSASFYDDSINASVAGGAPGLVDENGELIKIVRMRKEEIINCLCKITEEDGLMVQCEMCLCWQHAYCQDIRSSSEVPDTYVCSICRYPYRGRPSKRYAHDQDWLYEGKLPVAKYHSGNSKHPQRFDILKNCHTLTGNLLELKRFMHSLQVKINIAENKDHPKMYLWSKKWEKSPPRSGTTEPVASSVSAAGGTQLTAGGGDTSQQAQQMPQIPVPEAPIDPAECQAILLDHIQKQQNDAMGRLQAIEAQIIGLEAYDEKADLLESPTAKNYPKTKQTIHMLLNDLLKMKKIGAIHSDFNTLAQLEQKVPLQ
ncbi:AGAP006428-PA-like protein [Anopheles sinensis]|uniref:AGAP006428-PA-like protein n=1 Tax=Anopheles sinensis TaxID=74873 RepID=A0A084VCJ3_ANOSI|nr:AGAP006428-PA-like protein [Anopheles sinensis]